MSVDLVQVRPPITIPVVVDAAELAPGLARAIYFCFEAIEPSPGWYLGTPLERLSFLLIDIAGIIFAPIATRSIDENRLQLFTEAPLIEDTFAAIESAGTLMVVSASVYVPTAMLRVAEAPRRHIVYRLREDLFFAVHRASRDMWQADEYHRLADHYQESMGSSTDPPAVQFSPKETSALAEWSRQQLERAMDGYHAQFEAGEVAPRSELAGRRIF